MLTSCSQYILGGKRLFAISCVCVFVSGLNSKRANTFAAPQNLGYIAFVVLSEPIDVSVGRSVAARFTVRVCNLSPKAANNNSNKHSDIIAVCHI